MFPLRTFIGSVQAASGVGLAVTRVDSVKVTTSEQNPMQTIHLVYRKMLH
jgi:hypothetical protein